MPITESWDVTNAGRGLPLLGFYRFAAPFLGFAADDIAPFSNLPGIARVDGRALPFSFPFWLLGEWPLPFERLGGLTDADGRRVREPIGGAAAFPRVAAFAGGLPGMAFAGDLAAVFAGGRDLEEDAGGVPTFLTGGLPVEGMADFCALTWTTSLRVGEVSTCFAGAAPAVRAGG